MAKAKAAAAAATAAAIVLGARDEDLWYVAAASHAYGLGIRFDNDANQLNVEQLGVDPAIALQLQQQALAAEDIAQFYQAAHGELQTAR